ncbi:MAG: BamA/TamA family outer membrane protein [Candidatus Marinimicrobia bacterium]|nr:BamA/TamA family outer membrane protein [Candidatus Neomarinimicrobiota bacterium]
MPGSHISDSYCRPCLTAVPFDLSASSRQRRLRVREQASEQNCLKLCCQELLSPGGRGKKVRGGIFSFLKSFIVTKATRVFVRLNPAHIGQLWFKNAIQVRIIVMSVFFISAGISQDNEICLKFQGDREEEITAATIDEVDEHLNSLLRQYADEGYWQIQITCCGLEREMESKGTILSLWCVDNFEQITIDTVTVMGKTFIRPSIWKKIFAPILSMPADITTLKRVKNIPRMYSFFDFKAEPQYARTDKSDIALVVSVRESFNSRFIGTLGYQPERNKKDRLIGDIQVHLENTFNTASKADLWWYRKDEQSQVLSVSYEEPFIWKLNFGGRFHFYQNLQDGLYVQRKLGISVIKNSQKLGKWYIGGEKQEVTATPTGDSLGIADHTVRTFSIENEWDSRNALWNASRGFYLKWVVNLGDFNTAGGKKSILSRFESQLEWLRGLKKRWIFSLSGYGCMAYIYNDQNLPESEKIRYGGAKTLRGYFEQQFLSDWVILSSLEVRYKLGQVNRFYTFIDLAFQDVITPLPLGYGVGLLQRTPLGVLQLDYALGRDDKLSNGKVHMRLIGEF